MKHFFAILFLSVITLIGYSQESMVTVAGGYSFASFEGSAYTDENVKVTGWRINGLYEFNPNEGKWAQGFSMGYMSLKGSPESSDTVDFKVSTLPIFYAPKFMFGNDKVKGFLKGALGIHHTKFERSGPKWVVDGQDWGFYGGLGAGAMFFVSDMIFIDVEYEFAWLSNSSYQDGLMNTVMGGIGFKF